jgi:hypothetical protein
LAFISSSFCPSFDSNSLYALPSSDGSLNFSGNHSGRSEVVASSTVASEVSVEATSSTVVVSSSLILTLFRFN